MTRGQSLLRGLALAALLVAACHRPPGEGEGGGPAASESRVPVGLATVVRDSVVEALTLPGRLQPRPGGSALLAAPAAGVVRAVRAQIGDRVTRGSPVVELEVPELAADARQKTAEADQAEREAARQHRLLADGITSARQVEEAEARATQATAAAAAARDLLARTRLTSPINGQVQEVMVQPGERVDAGQPLAQVVASDTLDLVVPVPAAELPRLRAGLPATVFQEGDSTPARAWVAALAPGVDTLTNAGPVVIRVPNRARRLHPGAGAVARIRLGVHRGVLVVPDSAIVLVGDRSAVFVVGPDSIARQRIVERGARAAGRSEVRGELQPGDRVVTAGVFGLEDGMRVVLAPPPPERAATEGRQP